MTQATSLRLTNLDRWAYMSFTNSGAEKTKERLSRVNAPFFTRFGPARSATTVVAGSDAGNRES
jgi:hypothetical protein